MSDQFGHAQVILQANVAAPTQPAQLRATDVTSGEQQTAQFTIVQTINGSAVLSVVPATATITGPDNATCSTGFTVTYYIYGGTPPYTVASTFPNAVGIFGVPVLMSGGAFRAVTNGTCVNPLVFTIRDATGLQTTATLHQSGRHRDTPDAAADADRGLAGLLHGQPGAEYLHRKDVQFHDQWRHSAVQRRILRRGHRTESGHDLARVIRHQQLCRRVGKAYDPHWRYEQAAADRSCIGDVQLTTSAGARPARKTTTAPSGAVFLV